MSTSITGPSSAALGFADWQFKFCNVAIAVRTSINGKGFPKSTQLEKALCHFMGAKLLRKVNVKHTGLRLTQGRLVAAVNTSGFIKFEVRV